MKISADASDYEGYWNLISLVNKHKCTLADIQVMKDGEIWKYVLTADDEEGLIETARMHENGQLCISDDGNLIIDRLYGNVKFVFKGEE